jgi:hypothetical protein
MPPSVALAAPNRGGEPNPMQVARIWTVCLRFANLVTTCSRPSPRHCLRSLDIVRIEDSSSEHSEAAADADDREVFCSQRAHVRFKARGTQERQVGDGTLCAGENHDVGVCLPP